jgi:hypothetical protein
MRPFILLTLTGTVFGLLSTASRATGEVTLVRKVFGRASAPAHTTLPSGTAFTTAPRSGSELASSRGVVRVGENAELQTSTEGVILRRGITLVANDPGTFRKTIEVRAPGYRLKVRGTVQIAFEPGRSLKVVVLEGKATVALDSVLGESESLSPGQMLVINPSDRRLPDPVEIDLQRLLSTSTLVGGEFGTLATEGNIRAATAGQARSYAQGELLATSLLLRGLDNALQIERARRPAADPGDAARRALPARSSDLAAAEQSLFRSLDDLSDPKGVTLQRKYLFESGLTTTSSVVGFDFAHNAKNVGRTHQLIVELVPAYTLDDPDSPDAVSYPSQRPRIAGTVTASTELFADRPRTLSFTTSLSEPGFDRLSIEPLADVSSPEGVGLNFVADFGLDVDHAILKAGAAADASELLSITAASRGVTIKNDSTLSGGRVAIQGGASPGAEIAIDNSHVTAALDLSVGLASSPTGITIRNSSELKALAENLKLTANRANITVDGATLSAQRDLLIDTYIAAGKGDPENPAETPGVVSLRNAQLMAAAIRVRGFSAKGDALIVDGSTLTAAQLIKLYAEGVGTLRFRRAVTLTTDLAVLAGKTVEVDSGGTVEITGQGRVFTDHARFSTTDRQAPGYGTIHAKGGLTERSFGTREPFQR